MQTPLLLDIWLQSYEEFDNAKNSIKQRYLNSVFANISKTALPTSDSFLLIMSHIHADFYRNAFLLTKLSNLSNFRAIRALNRRLKLK